MVLAMPNTNPPIVNEQSFQLVKDLARAGARCDYGLFVGASSDNYNTIYELASEAAALKMYLNDTFSTLKLTDMTIWEKHLSRWPKRAPLCVHAEKQSTAAIILMASLLDRPIHICHVARKEEILIIRAAKERGIRITCEVCPHHLFLSTKDLDRIGHGRGEVRPMLCSPEDQQALWDNIDVIDIFATDHAPHTTKEKNSENPPPGFPGLETILPLLLTAVNDGRITLEDLINKFHRNPKRIFNLPEQPNTYVEVDMDEEWVIPAETAHSKARWTPFAGMRVKGMIHRVVLRGEVAFVDGEVLAAPGFGLNVRELTAKRAMQHQSTEKVNLNGSLDGLDMTKFPELPKDHFDDELHIKIPTTSSAHLQPLSPIPPRTRLDSIGAQIYKEVLHSQHHSHDQVGRLALPLGRSLAGKHILTVDMFHKEHLNDIFTLASVFKARVHKDRSLDEVLRGKVMASVFYEVSTRTSCSFAAAMQRLGGRVIYMDGTSSSVKKGESLEDSISVMAGYADVVVLRHPEPGAVTRVSNTCRKPILNAGDGIGNLNINFFQVFPLKIIFPLNFPGEHPTQALLDIFTIREEIGTVNGLTITMVGDLKHGRTVHSLARLLTLYNVNLNYVSPDNLGMPSHIIEFVRSKGINQNITTSLDSVLAETDVLYMTRIQKERFPSEEEYKKACGHYVITPAVMTKAKRKMIVMHPLPRVFEISKQFDTDPRAAYFRQAEYGMYLRMSILAMVLTKP